MPATKYTLEDAGCYADGALGHRHCRAQLADLVEPCDAEIATSLRGEMPDDAWDEDAALDLLNEHCAEDVYWTFNDGDLVLCAQEEGD